MSEKNKLKDGPATVWWVERANPDNRGRVQDYPTREAAAVASRRADKMFPLYRHWHTPAAPESQRSAPPPRERGTAPVRRYGGRPHTLGDLVKFTPSRKPARSATGDAK